MQMRSIECLVHPRPGFVQPLDASETGSNHSCRVIHQDGMQHVLSWIDLPESDGPLVRIGNVSLSLHCTLTNENLLLGFSPQPGLELHHFMPDGLCPISGVVTEAAQLIDGLSSLPLLVGQQRSRPAPAPPSCRRKPASTLTLGLRLRGSTMVQTPPRVRPDP